MKLVPNGDEPLKNAWGTGRLTINNSIQPKWFWLFGFSLTLLLCSGTLAVLVNAAENSIQVIYSQDFEQEIPAEWRGTAAREITTAADEVLAGAQSVRISGGKLFLTDPELQVTPGTRLQVTFVYKIVNREHSGAVPHAEVRIVGVNRISPYLKHNFLRIDKAEGYTEPAGTITTEPFLFPFEDSVRLMFRCIGPASLIIDSVRVNRVTVDRKPEGAPEIVSPLRQEEMTYPALSFQWKATPDGREVRYEIQIDSTADFTSPGSEIFYIGGSLLEGVGGEHAGPGTRGAAKKRVFKRYPEKALDPGRWYWRVRGGNHMGTGDWSRTGEFLLTEMRANQPPSYRPSVTTPLFHLEGTLDHWNYIPESLRDYTWLKVRQFQPGQYGEEMLSKLQKYEDAGIPVLLFRYEPSAEMEHIYRNFDNVKGVIFSESGGQGTPADQIAAQLKRALQLSAQYGKLVFLQEASWRQLTWVNLTLNQDFLHTVKEYKEYFVPQVKYNMAFTPLFSQLVLMGLWLSGTVDQWGVQPESWYLHPWKYRGDMNPTMYARMVLTAASGGATVFTFEPPWDIWAGDTRSLTADTSSRLQKGFSRTWREIMNPLQAEIVTQQLIPDRKEVLKRTEVGILAREEDGSNPGGIDEDITWGSGDFFPVLNAIYRCRHHAELIPNDGRYYFLPVIPERLPRDQRPGIPLITTELGSTESAAQTFLDRHYTNRSERPDGGFSTQVGNTYFVMHSQEHANKSVHSGPPEEIDDEAFSIELNRDNMTNIRGSLGLHQFLVIQNKPRGVRIHCGNQRHVATELTVKAVREPDFQVKPRSALLRADWEEETGNLNLAFQHVAGNVIAEFE